MIPVKNKTPIDFALICEILPSALIIIDTDGYILKANKATAKLFKINIEGLKWQNIVNKYFCFHPLDGQEVTLISGEKIQVLTTPILSPKCQLIILNDLSLSREAQEKMHHMQRLIQLGKMISSLAHQIRTPLSSALLYSQNLLKKLTKEKRKNFQIKLNKGLKDIEYQINQMLMFVKKDAKVLKNKILFSDFINQLQDHLLTIYPKQKIYINQINTKNMLYINSKYIFSAIENLINNSFEAQSSVVEITFAIVKNFQIINIIDNGKGLNQELNQQEKQNIFVPFFTTKSAGTGLGLAIVKNILNEHQGKISIQNNKDSGTTTSIYLPVA